MSKRFTNGLSSALPFIVVAIMACLLFIQYNKINTLEDSLDRMGAYISSVEAHRETISHLYEQSIAKEQQAIKEAQDARDKIQAILNDESIKDWASTPIPDSIKEAL